MGVSPEEEATRTDYWGQDGQFHGSMLLNPSFQESQLPLAPPPRTVAVCVEREDRCVRSTGAGRQVPAVWLGMNGKIL